MTPRAVLLLVLTLAAATGRAQSVGYTATFAAPGDVAGFVNEAGECDAVDGYLRVTRAGGVNVSARPLRFLRDDWGVLFGTRPGTIRFEIKALSEHHVPEIHFWLSDGGSAFRYIASARQELGHAQTAADGWVRYSIPWCAAWTDAEAAARGWSNNGTQASWAKVIRNPVHSHLTVLGTEADGDQVIGLDNFQVEAGSALDDARLALLTSPHMPEPEPQRQPVADYRFTAGAGDVLRDHSGNDADGTIHGARWVRDGRGWALEFDGADDHVDFGTPASLNLRCALTVEAWVYAEPIYSVWLGFTVAGTDSYRIAQHVQYIEGWSVRPGIAFLPARTWIHVASAWDGRNLRLYVDGRLVAVTKAVGMLSRAGPFQIAPERPTRPGEPEAYKGRFKGKLAALRVYNRALTQAEVHADLLATRLTGVPGLAPVLRPGIGVIRVEVDAARTGTIPSSVPVELRAGANLIERATAGPFDDRGRSVIDLNVPALAAGRYTLHAGGGEKALDWPGSAVFPDGDGRLNNLVTELLRIDEADTVERTFRNPRTGFIFITNDSAQTVTLSSEATGSTALELTNDYGNTYETMRSLPAGDYLLTAAAANNLRVRSVAITFHDYAHTERTYIEPFGPYAGAFEDRHIFPHTNTLFVHEANIDKPFAAKWRSRGRRLLGGLTARLEPETGESGADAAYRKLATAAAFTRSGFDGVTLDEFANADDRCRSWAQGIERALAQPPFQDKTVLAYDYALVDLIGDAYGPEGRELFETLRRHDGGLLWEAYLDYQRTELDAWRHMADKLAGEVAVTESLCAGFTRGLIVVLYAYVTAGPPWLTMNLPNVDNRTYLDMQMQLIATHPAFRGIGGVGVYRSPYADEETARWTARLFRHYALEGNTTRLGRDPYELEHVRNPEFEQDGTGWDLSPAEEGSIRFETHLGLGYLQGRYGRMVQGETGLIARRSGRRPNTFSQQIRGLEPGRLYSFRMFSADCRDFTRMGPDAVNIQFENVALLPEQCFTAVCPGNAKQKKNAWINWHVRVFRAQAETARLTVSDWTAANQPAGPVGRDIKYNFIKVQPYWPVQP